MIEKMTFAVFVLSVLPLHELLNQQKVFLRVESMYD